MALNPTSTQALGRTLDTGDKPRYDRRWFVYSALAKITRRTLSKLSPTTTRTTVIPALVAGI
ncbi:protein of unknown function [Candidatus Filomicrobium marinum]|nr:protein of unknown function [Candidatus Filomicrobium marinum]